ncbi:MAG: BON domain-containing protein [Acidobacteriaceae bacterium]|nr:BON domain-containing protein [Acidobacteriaceae bacterium]MBV9500498.1 BON domain-containing protein [Acidobacteriaceae bacterium]
MRRVFTLFLVSLLAITLGLPAQAAGSGRTSPTAVKAGTVSDAQIDATIRAKLAKSKIGKDGFRFHVQRGVVTWEGTTSVIQHKGSATRMAHAAGAVQVVNNIQVSASAKAKAAGNLKKAVVEQ